ncbi:MAG: hypothetical protein AAFY10_05770 [Pseudomonadota bacterium]
MSRKLLALLVALFAVAFTVAALAVMRWPTILMVMSLAMEDGLGPALEGVNWRQLGLIYGVPYLFAGCFLYVSAQLISQRRHGAFTTYVIGCALGFPCAMMVDFEPGWWRDPSSAEGAVAGAGVIALLMMFAVWELRKGKPVKAAEPEKTEEMVTLPASVVAALGAQPAVAAAAPAPPSQPTRVRSAAVMNQRAHFAREGRKMLERQAARRGR